MRQALKFVAIWASCVLAIGVFLFGAAFGLQGAGRRIALSRSWRATTGTVVAVDRSNHNSVTVHYSAEGREVEETFTGSQSRVGETVEVYYATNDPTLAALENPTVSLRNDLLLLSLAGLAFGTFASVIINFRAAGQALAWPWARFRLKPRFVVTWMAIGVFVGTISSLFSVSVVGRPWLANVFVICGATLTCVQAFRLSSETPWSVFLRSRIVIIGVVLVLIGQLLNWGWWH